MFKNFKLYFFQLLLLNCGLIDVLSIREECYTNLNTMGGLWEIYRYSSVLVSWVKWKNFVTNVFQRSFLGCNHGFVVTSQEKTSSNYKNNGNYIHKFLFGKFETNCFNFFIIVLPYKLYNATCANTCNSVPGHGGNCGKRSNLFSTSPESRTNLP